MHDDIVNMIAPTGPSPTIGDRGVRLHQAAIRRRIDFYHTTGRLNGLIVLIPITYGFVQTRQGHELQPWFWWTVAVAVCFALVTRRAPFLRLTPKGMMLPQQHTPLYPWNQMCEAHARAEEMEIMLAGGERLKIPYRNMRASDIQRLKRLVKSQFQWITQQSKAQVA